MRKLHYLLLPPITGIILIAALLVTAKQSANAQPTASGSRGETAHTIVMQPLTVTTAAPVTNQALNVIVTFTNPMVSTTVSSPLYTLEIATADELTILVPEDARVQHGGDIAPNASDSAQFTLYPIAGGSITLTAIVIVSAQLSPPVTTRIGWRAQPITVVIPVPSQAAAIIYEDAYRSGCMDEYALFFQIAAGDGWGSYNCAFAAGHFFSTSLARAESSSAATDAFNARRGDHELEAFHCHRAYSWRERPYDGPITYSGHGWIADRWVNISHAEDDTPYGSARGASEGIYRLMELRGLIGPCMGTYLPIISR